MKARDVVIRGGRTYRSYIPSKKLNRMIHCESNLERDAVNLFEFSCAVVKYQEQPALIHYLQGLETHKYFPDFEVTLTSGEKIHIEIKPASKLAQPKVFKKLSAIAEHYKKLPIDFKILTEVQIRKEPLFSNLKLLAKNVRQPKDITGELEKVKVILGTKESYSLEKLAQKIELNTCLRLIAKGDLVCNLSEELLSPVNFVQVVEGDDHAAVLF